MSQLHYMNPCDYIMRPGHLKASLRLGRLTMNKLSLFNSRHVSPNYALESGEAFALFGHFSRPLRLLNRISLFARAYNLNRIFDTPLTLSLRSKCCAPLTPALVRTINCFMNNPRNLCQQRFQTLWEACYDHTQCGNSSRNCQWLTWHNCLIGI